MVADSCGCWDLQHKERAIPTLALEDTKCSVIVLARTLEAAGWTPFTGDLVHKPDEFVTQLSVVRFSSRRALFQCLLEMPRIWELGEHRMSSNDCILFYKCLLKGEVIEPALGDAHCKAVLGDSPDLPAGPTALTPQLALVAPRGQPAASIMDAESSESGEVLTAGLHDGDAAFVVSTATPAPASSSLPSASVQTPADFATQKVAASPYRASLTVDV